MRHLFSSRVEVLRLAGTLVDGSPVQNFRKLEIIVDPLLNDPGEMMCRLDLTFVRPGKDQPPAQVAGRAIDRTGVMFCSFTDQLKAGDRVRTISGPVSGTFDIRNIPDPVPAFSTVHHIEVQVIEVAQMLMNVFPAANLED